VIATRGEANERERALRLFAHQASLVTGHGQSERDVLGHGLSRKQLEVLEDDAHLTAEQMHARARHPADVFTVDDDATA
jgi:hypothetical protein